MYSEEGRVLPCFRCVSSCIVSPFPPSSSHARHIDLRLARRTSVHSTTRHTTKLAAGSEMAEVGVFLEDMAKLLTQFDVRIVRVKQSLKTAFHVDRKTRSGAS